MNVYIRTNFSNKIGLGHLTRSKRLAIEMEKKGINCIFFLDNYCPNNLLNFQKIFLYKNEGKFFSEMKDARTFCEHTKHFEKGYVLIDDYRIGKKWEKYVSKYHKKIIVFDDLEDKEHYADVVINYNPKHSPIIKYDYKKNKKIKCNYLISPKYNIISKQKINKTYNFSKNKFYITFYIGGGGNLLIYYKLLSLISKTISKQKNVKLLIVLGPLSENTGLIKKISKKYKCVDPIIGHDNLNYIMKMTNVFVGTSGTAIFETASLQTPSILFESSQNQKTDVFSLEKIGHYFYLNLDNLQFAKKFSELILILIKNYKRFKLFVKNPEVKIDNHGSGRLVNLIFFNSKFKKRVKKKIEFKPKQDLKIRPVEDKDINHYLYCRNLNLNKKNSSNNKSISILDHYIWWFKTKRKSYVLLRDGKKILYFYEEELPFLSKSKYLLSGWFACVENCTIKEILKALNWQRNKDKKIKWISFIKKTNLMSIKLSKYIGWKNMDKKNKIINVLSKNFKINPDKFIFQER